MSPREIPLMNNLFKTDDETNLGFWCEQPKVTIS